MIPRIRPQLQLNSAIQEKTVNQVGFEPYLFGKRVSLAGGFQRDTDSRSARFIGCAFEFKFNYTISSLKFKVL